jgi:hypothetical protein
LAGEFTGLWLDERCRARSTESVITRIAQHTRLARLIDTHIREILAHSGSDEARRMVMADAMGPLQRLETCTDAGMDARCERYNGLYYCATRLEQGAEGIAKGRIPVPACSATGA